MASIIAIDEQFTDDLNAAFRLYAEDRLVECQEQALGLLEEDTMPEYHRIRTLILLGSILGDWEEADNCRRDAWALYKTVRGWHPKGKDPTADEHLDDLHTMLEDLDEALESDAPGWDEEVDEDEDVSTSDDEDSIEDTRAELESLDMADTAPSAIAAHTDMAEPATASTAAVESGTVYVHPE